MHRQHRGMLVVCAPKPQNGEQDDQGCLGVVEQLDDDGNAHIRWDTGVQRCYSVYDTDIRIYDSGVMHMEACSGCGRHNITGLRWLCAVCPRYGLCSACYHSNMHSITHAFYHHCLATADQRQTLQPRQGARRIPLHSVPIMERGTVSDGLVASLVNWSAQRDVAEAQWQHLDEVDEYQLGSKSKSDLRLVASPSNSLLVYVDHLPLLASAIARVLPLDGGHVDQLQHDLGIDLDSDSSTDFSGSSTASGQMRRTDRRTLQKRPIAGNCGRKREFPREFNRSLTVSQTQRVGKQRMRRCRERVESVLRRARLVSRVPAQPSPPVSPFQVNDLVRLNSATVDEDAAPCTDQTPADQTMFLLNSIKDKVGRVLTVFSDGLLSVIFRGERFLVQAAILQHAERDEGIFLPGDSVYVQNDLRKVKELQVNHGGWNDSLNQCLGNFGRVLSVDDDDDVTVQVCGFNVLFNPALLTRVRSATATIPPRDEATNNSDVFVTASNDEFINQLVNRVLSSSGSAERGEDQPATKRPRLRSNSSQQQRQEDCESPLECKVCRFEKISTAFQCGHLVCKTCSERLTSICPICRAVILMRIRIYL